MCAQAARTVRVDEARASGSVGVGALAALPPGKLREVVSELDGEETASLVAGLNNNAEKLVAVSEAISFLDTGMFYLCQIAGNQDLDEDIVDSIAEAIIEGATSIGTRDTNPSED
ncbi:MAG: hypothetical protein AAGG45_05870 [Pseudomonadota bacterium]